MRRLLPIILTLFIVLTQAGLALHTYQDHNTNEVCHLCLASSQHDHALPSSPLTLSISAGYSLQASRLPTTSAQAAIAVYHSRAPPFFL